MARVATTLLLVLALFNVAHGDLLRPCACGPDNPMSCGQCPSGRASEPAPAPC